jgi:S-adenosylmethionine decarboxylase proenzyme
MNNIVIGTQVGTHLIVNLYDIEDEDLLCYIWKGRQITSHIIQLLDLHIVGHCEHQFDPVGYTIAYALSESHFTIHTYPEYKSAYLDIFCCNPNFDPLMALEVLKEAFKTNTSKHIIIRR